MDWLSTIGVSIVVFAATNIDDLLLLGLFFADRSRQRRHIVAGQFLGIGALIFVSAIGSLLALAFPPAWIALLGVIPLALGLKGLWDLRDQSEEPTSLSPAGSTIVVVAGVTIANGSDNLGAYLPLFATLSTAELAVTVVVFFCMTGIWCLASLWLLRHRRFASIVERFGPILLPYVLIGLGLWILSDSLSLVIGFLPTMSNRNG